MKAHNPQKAKEMYLCIMKAISQGVSEICSGNKITERQVDGSMDGQTI